MAQSWERIDWEQIKSDIESLRGDEIEHAQWTSAPPDSRKQAIIEAHGWAEALAKELKKGVGGGR